ncbi:hypothetical protein Celaphus_00017415 [Cervus elaphus hippelaphus]|uniref:Large ribosomal subunit protein uL29 n=1 Tax=Cervus elaphus hippelaphus TaxID=46360 RepID=A0A212D5M8_CEREH|nr:hypothetical protein Celaphus_00017415 [Cervus elaphus hippelaphus]
MSLNCQAAQHPNYLKTRVVCKSIAFVLTTINQTQKENLRKFYKSTKYKPLELQPKKRRAMHCQLNMHEENLKTTQQQQKEWL